LHDDGDEELSEKLFLIGLLHGLITQAVYFVEEVPERDEFSSREPWMNKSYAHFNPV